MHLLGFSDSADSGENRAVLASFIILDPASAAFSRPRPRVRVMNFVVPPTVIVRHSRKKTRANAPCCRCRSRPDPTDVPALSGETASAAGRLYPPRRRRPAAVRRRRRIRLAAIRRQLALGRLDDAGLISWKYRPARCPGGEPLIRVRQSLGPIPTTAWLRWKPLYIAYHILGRPTAGLLDHYRWAAEFLRCTGMETASWPRLDRLRTTGILHSHAQMGLVSRIRSGRPRSRRRRALAPGPVALRRLDLPRDRPRSGLCALRSGLPPGKASGRAVVGAVLRPLAARRPALLQARLPRRGSAGRRGRAGGAQTPI